MSDKAVGVPKEIPRSFLAQPVEERLVRRYHELAQNGALLLARQPQVAFEPILVAYAIELLLITCGGRLFQMIIQAGTRVVYVLVAVILVAALVVPFAQRHRAHFVVFVSDYRVAYFIIPPSSVGVNLSARIVVTH